MITFSPFIGGSLGNSPITTTGTITAGALATTAGGVAVVGGSVDVQTAGQGLKVAEGANAKQGVATLVAGTVTVATTAVTANSRILLTVQTVAGTQGTVTVTARTAGTSFTITSTNVADTSTVAWEIIEPG